MINFRGGINRGGARVNIGNRQPVLNRKQEMHNIPPVPIQVVSPIRSQQG